MEGTAQRAYRWSPGHSATFPAHSVGRTVHGFGGYANGEEVPTLVQMLDGVKPANSAAVRVAWRYSGGGFSIIQLVIEDVTHNHSPRRRASLVLELFGMENSTVDHH